MNKHQFDPNCPFQTITLESGINVYVDTEDFDKVKNFHWFDSNGYAATGHDNLRMHHLILGLTEFSIVEVHHKNENTYDNTRRNLQVLSFSDHLITRPKQTNNNTGGFKGVCWKKPQGNRKGKFVAQIGKNKRKTHIGYFDTAIEAAKAYDKKAKELFGDVAYLNFPDEQ